MSETIRLTRSTPAEEILKREQVLREKALSYLRSKYPETDEEVFFTDYTGRTYADVIQVFAVAQAAEMEEMCGKCKGGVCVMPEAMKAKDSRPVVRVSKSAKGFSYLEVRWTSGMMCKYERIRVDFDVMFKKSGINGTRMTFKTYESLEAHPELARAKAEAVKASRDGTNLILGGKAGTGKTHLAVAIAITAMKEGRQALFRLVSTMLDEIQSSIRECGDYDGLMRQFKTVPCLVLDDLGHENMTAARASYLHQIIDYRYVHNLQTIVTTNAKDVEELCVWDKEEYVRPMMSRILERGKWVTMRNTEDYRMKGSTENGKCTEE